MLTALIDSFTTAPAALLGAYPSLPLLHGVRQALHTALAAAVKVRQGHVLPALTASPSTGKVARIALLQLDGATAHLPACLQATNAVHGLVVAAGCVAAACAAPGVPAMQQWDVLLLLNLLGANESFRHSGEAMTPICLPRYNSGAQQRWRHASIHPCTAPSFRTPQTIPTDRPPSACTHTCPACSCQPACIHLLR